MDEAQKKDLARALVELISKNAEVRAAVMDCACACPNLVVEY